jgi:hypothetical protein
LTLFCSRNRDIRDTCDPGSTINASPPAPPHTFNAGPFGTVAITGILSGMGLTQSNWIPGDKSSRWDLSFYSNVFNWITGSVMWQFNASNSLMFVGGGNVGQTKFNPNTSASTPFLQNNGQIYNIMYTYSHENWMITPYWQYPL